MICVGVFGSMLCLCTAFSIPVLPASREPVFPSFWVMPPFLALVGCFCFRGKAGKYYALGFLGVFALFVLLLWNELGESFRNLWGVLSVRFAKGYDRIQDLVPRDPSSPEATHGAVLTLTILETFVCTLSVRMWRRTFPSALALLPGILPCFVLTDTPPALLPLFAAVFSILTQIYSQTVRRRAAGEEPKSICIAALLSAALLGLLLLIFPQKDYEPPITWNDLSSKMDRWTARQNNQGNVDAGLSGNPEEVDLTSLGALPNHPATVLYVLSTRDANLYLRGSSYSDFSGSRWRRGAEKDWDRSCLFPYLRRMDGETLTLESVEPESLLYSTYQTTQLPAGAVPVSDAYLNNPEGRLRYTMRYLTGLGPVTSYDHEYDAWVMRNCLALPDETREGVLDWWESNRGGLPLQPIEGRLTDGLHFSYLLADGVDSLEALAEQIAGKVSRCAAYSRNPLPMPDDVDFCTWFLNDAEQGYCVHYATACTALLRALGIPARYVSGYICSVKANHTVSVTNLQAHAWVEIWSGGRWVCIEATPGDATEFGGWGGETGAEPVPVTETPITSEREETGTERLSPEPTEYTRPVPTRPGRQNETNTEYGRSGYDNTVDRPLLDLTWLWVFLSVTGFLALVLGRRALALRLWERKLARAPINERARLYYRRCLRLRRHRGGSVTPEAERIAKKAGFSQHTLSDEEIEVLRQLHDQQVCRVGISGFWNKLYCKYVLAII